MFSYKEKKNKYTDSFEKYHLLTEQFKWVHLCAFSYHKLMEELCNSNLSLTPSLLFYLRQVLYITSTLIPVFQAYRVQDFIKSVCRCVCVYVFVRKYGDISTNYF